MENWLVELNRVNDELNIEEKLFVKENPDGTLGYTNSMDQAKSFLSFDSAYDFVHENHQFLQNFRTYLNVIFNTCNEYLQIATNECYGIVIPDRVTTQIISKGILSIPLSDSVTSADSTRVPSRNAVKIAYDKALEAFNLATNNKGRIDNLQLTVDKLSSTSNSIVEYLNTNTTITSDKLNRLFVINTNLVIQLTKNGFFNGWGCYVKNRTSSIIRFNCTGCTLEGKLTYDLVPNNTIKIVYDGASGWVGVDFAGVISN